MTPREFGLVFAGFMDRIKQGDRWVGRICALMANMNRDPKKRPKPYTEDEFMPKTVRERRQSPEQMLATVKALNRLYGGKGG